MHKLNPVKFIILSLFLACNFTQHHTVIKQNEVPLLWADMTLFITQNTPSNSPTFASRALGYIGVTMYESVVHSSTDFVSLAGQLNGLPELPLPEKDKKYCWPLSLNAGQAAILRNIYVQSSRENRSKIDSLENLISRYYKDSLSDNDISERSIKYGKQVAAAVFQWSKIDGGHRGYLVNFDKNMVRPSRAGAWKPPFFAQTISRLPLHPYWGENRTFLTTDTAWVLPAFTPFDSMSHSAYYKQFMDVYNANKQITTEQKEIAVWWNDDPSETYSPPGHSYNLATTILKIKKPDMVKTAETYARVGLAVADAFIVCWKLKYHFFSERPSTFINEHVDPEWDPFWPDPPFPSFPSGHATQAASTATVLADLYGNNLDFTDSSHYGRPMNRLRDVEYKPRKFHSFWAVAEETAYSRFLGGIHTKEENSVGLSEGAKIGQHVNDLKWER